MASRSQAVFVINAAIDPVNWSQAIERISDWSALGESRYVCLCNAHSIVTAGQSAEFGRALDAADLATPDGAPVAWMMQKLGHGKQQRINGPDLMWKYCTLANQKSESIFLYGSTPDTLAVLQEKLSQAFPLLTIAGAYSPPFRELTDEEDAQVVGMINASGARTVWVGLGCPKQEIWMAAHKGRINAVMLGVGAAFDYHAGVIKRAPLWMQNAGLEWLHRLCSEPRRLWRRYTVTNTLFIIGAYSQLIKRRFAR